jgi:copper resistance protein D
VGSVVPALNILATFLSDASYAFLVGAGLAGYWLRAGGVDYPDKDATASAFALRRFVIVCLSLLIVCHLVHPWFLASSMSGSTQFRPTLALIPTILSSTRQGGFWYTNSIALAILLGIQFLSGNRAGSTAAWVSASALCVLAATKAASSHASEQGDFSLAEIAQLVHLLATSVWAGAIVVSGFLVAPRMLENRAVPALWSYGKNLSRTVTWALIILVLSGLYVAWGDMHRTFSVLWSSQWGAILLTKSALAGSAVILGGFSRFRCLGRPASSDRAGMMTKLLRAEAFVMMAILCVSSVLGNSNPGVE